PELRDHALAQRQAVGDTFDTKKRVHRAGRSCDLDTRYAGELVDQVVARLPQTRHRMRDHRFAMSDSSQPRALHEGWRARRVVFDQLRKIARERAWRHDPAQAKPGHEP